MGDDRPLYIEPTDDRLLDPEPRLELDGKLLRAA